MAVTWIPVGPAPTSSPQSAEPVALEIAEAHALADFPSESDSRPWSRGIRTGHRSGVTMRVEPISWGVAWGVAVIVLLGLGSAAAIGILANRDTLLRAPAVPELLSRQ